MKQINKLIYLIIIVSSIYSCDSFLDVNEDKDNPTSEVVEPNFILPAALNASYSIKIDNQNELGAILTNQWAGDVTNFSSINVDEYNYNISNTFYNQVWEKNYIVTDKFQAIINKDSEQNTNFTAIAKIMMSHNMQYIVDIYGDAPYSEAFKRGGNYQPKYDDAREIYKGLYANLEEAILLIDNASVTATNPGNADVMLNGDMEMWKKLANTLKLKLLVRANSSSDGAVQTWVNAKFPELANVQFLNTGDNILINPGYLQDVGKQNPFWNKYGFLSNGDQTQTNKVIVGSKFFIEYLKGNSAPFVADARISKYFTMASGSSTFQGIEQGNSDPDDPAIGLSFIGNGLLRNATQNGWFFTASESLFLQAEATLNGNIAGDANQLFEDAISESFSLLGLPSDAAAFISSIYTAPVSLEDIINQKWVALHGTDGGEIFIEHNRTGFPTVPLPITVTGDTHIPYRLMYPQSEFTGNSVNVINVTRAEVFTPGLFYQN